MRIKCGNISIVITIWTVLKCQIGVKNEEGRFNKGIAINGVEYS